jgi:hypothetical protein
MRRDTKTNLAFALATAIAVPTLDYSAAHFKAGNSVDLSDAGSVTFVGVVTAVAAGASMIVKVQYSNNNTDWTDETDTHYGNDVATASITATGLYKLHVPNPHARYYRTYATALVDDMTYTEISVAGPLFSVPAGTTVTV